MSHALDRWCKAHIGETSSDVECHDPLTHLEAENVKSILLEDACGYFYSGLVSIADACSGLERCYFSWATCKLYYSVFYSVRGLLALRGYGVYYVQKKPYVVRAEPISKINRLKKEARGGTHSTILNLFCSVAKSHILLSQPIDGCNSLMWLKEKREEAIYGHARYCEPDAPWWFSNVSKYGVRRVVNEYLQGSEPELRAFDPDHAVLAFPILASKYFWKEFVATKRPPLDKNDINLISSLFVDKRGRISSISTIFR